MRISVHSFSSEKSKHRLPIYIYIYIYRERERERERERGSLCIDFSVYSARYVELERGICCDRGNKTKNSPDE